MAAYDEEDTLPRIVPKVLAIPHLLELIIVDDCSSDRTPDIARDFELRDPRVRFVRHSRNAGKTAALKSGFAMTTGDIVVVQDADLEYDPEEIEAVIAPILAGHADVVLGSRFTVRRATRVLYFSHYVANKIITLISNVLTNVNISDVETCYKAFRGDIIRNMVITSRGFGFEVEVVARVAKLGCPIYEVPISYYGRTYEEGKKIGLRDGVDAVFYMIKYNLFTSLKSSFTALPTRTRDEQRYARGGER